MMVKRTKLLKNSVAKMSHRRQLNNIRGNVQVMTLALNPQNLTPVNPNSIGISPIPAMILWMGLRLCLQNQVGLQSQRKNMPLFFRYMLSNILQKFPRWIRRMIPNLLPFLREVFSESKREKFILNSLPNPNPSLLKRQRLMVSSGRILLPPLHFRGLGNNLVNAMALVGSIHPRTLLPFNPFVLQTSPVPAMINFLALKLLVQPERIRHRNQTNSISFSRQYLMSKFMRYPIKLIQRMIPHYHLFMTQVFREAVRANPLCRPGIALPIVPIFFGAIDAQQLWSFREMVRSCVNAYPYFSLMLSTRESYRVLVELYCVKGSIRYFSITVFDQFGELVGAEAITDLKASQQTRDLFVPKATPQAIHLSNEVSNRSRFQFCSHLEFGYTFNVFFNIGNGDFNLNIEGVKISTKKP